ncbi:MAG: cupin domain-containing protein [Kiritimatiellia bacterium]
MKFDLPIKNIYEQIKSAPLDPAVGIRVVPLTGGDDFSLFAAEIGPKKRVGAHYHAAGGEIYQIVEGSGTIHIGKPAGAGKTDWLTAAAVKKGDCFTIQEGEVHQLVNDQDERLIALFGCPKSHLSTDRTMVKGFGDA